MTRFMTLAQVNFNVIQNFRNVKKIAQCNALYLINNIHIKILKNIYFSNIIKIYLILIF